jgi:invasion protein IalB
MLRQILATLALGTVALAGAAPAAAQAYPPPPPGAYHPGYGDRTFAGRYHVQGWVTSFGGFNLMLRIHGGAQPVNLHQGTVLAPLGLTMVPGMLVRCDGYFNGNGVFVAQQIALIR